MAQCTPTWNDLSQLGFGVNGQVRALQRWDPDGSGPLREVVVVGGGFSEAGGVPGYGIGKYECAPESASFGTPDLKSFAPEIIRPSPGGDTINRWLSRRKGARTSSRMHPKVQNPLINRDLTC